MFDFFLGPHIELAFHPFAVGIFGAEESAFGRSHVPVDIVQKIVGKIGKLFFAGDLIGFDQGGGEQGVVIEHFFKMRHQPFVIRTVTGKAAADLVINPSELHSLERIFRHRQAVAVTGAVVLPEQEREPHRRRKLVLLLKLKTVIETVVMSFKKLNGLIFPFEAQVI